MQKAPDMLKELYYITHIDNIPSILERGILSHERIESEGIQYTPIYDLEIVKSRQEKKAPNGKSLWSFANLFFQARNPMLYRVNCEKGVENIAIIGVNRVLFSRSDSFVSTGNAAHHKSKILSQPTRLDRSNPDRKEFFRVLKEISKMVWWNEGFDAKRRIMAECLILDEIPPEYIQSIYVANHDIAKKVEAMIQSNISPVPSPYTFFEPYKRTSLTPNFSIVDGDMFFSRKQTLTISVNCVGVMGKGLASRARDQFPDVYVHYQKLCRKKTLRMGHPYLYKSDKSLDVDLADDPKSLTCANSESLFLLFPTKNHWKQKADIHGIEKGLQWIRENYREEGITSLALPALGCGLGWLDWRDVGPLIYKYLADIDIEVEIYLPIKKKIKEQYISKEFLSKNVTR